MSETTTPRTRSAGFVRPLTGCLLALFLAATTLAASTLVAVPPSSASAGAAPTAHRWAGYRIPPTGRAAGGWIGGYRVRSTPVFVITPGRRPNRAGFRAARPSRNLHGKKGPSKRRTARAAWILSKYGGYRDDTQAAAVDAAVLHLLAGRRWEVGSRRGARRIRASGDPATVKRYVRVMLRQSRASAGRYRAVVTPTTADVGGVTSVTVRVTDGRGGPVAGLPVRVTSPDGGASVPAAGPVKSVTGDDGRAVVRLAAPLAGWRTVTARVGKVPAHRLRVRKPRRKGQAAVAEGGVRRTIVASAPAAVRGPQTVDLTPTPGSLVLGAQASVVAAVRGDGAPRAAAAALFGPFETASSATCSGASVGSVGATLPGDGSHTLPALSPPAGGYYAWRVDVDGTATSTPATACGAVVKVRGRPTVVVAAPESSAAGNVIVAVTVAGMPFAQKVDVRLKAYDVTSGALVCTSAYPERTQSRIGNGDLVFTDMWIADPGRYAFKAELVAGELWQGTESLCGADGSVTQVG